MADTFRHPELGDRPRMIRLLRLLPSSLKWSAVHASLEVVSLDTSPSPVFEALSYTWGTDPPIRRITCNGLAFAVRSNLYSALRRLRYRTKPRLLWIDAICIDQANNAEKNTQIPLMGAIYRTATRGLIWLGEAADDSALAMALARKLSKIMSGDLEEDGSRALLFRDAPLGMPSRLKDWFDELIDDDSDIYESTSSDSDDDDDGKGGLGAGVAAIPGVVGNVMAVAANSFVGIFAPDDPEREGDSHSSASDSDESSVFGTNRLADVYLPTHGHRAWKALRALINRPWFSRIWIIQEVALSRRAVVMCGRDELPWKVVKAAADALLSAGLPSEAGGRAWLKVLGIARAADAARGRLDRPTMITFGGPVEDLDAPKVHRLTSLLAATLHTNATDPRDKIYGVLALLEGKLPVRVDYGMPVEVLYRDVARFLLTSDELILPLYLDGATRKLGALPSWVPDWSVPRDLGSTILSAEDLDYDRLKGDGVDPGLFRAAIKDTGDPNELALRGRRLDTITKIGTAVEPGYGPDNTRQSVEAALRDWVKMLTAAEVFIRPGEKSETVFEALWRSLVANMEGQRDKPPEEYHACFSNWLRELGIDSRTLKPRACAADEEKEAVTANPRELERFLGDAVCMCVDRRLCISATGWLCLAPASAAEGDHLVFFNGGLTPFVVREKEVREECSSYGALIGPCYVHGFHLGDLKEAAAVDMVLR
jgi:hypothetical protein